MSSQELENRIRKFLVEELMREKASVIGIDEPLDLDSLDQTELKVFLDEEYSIKFDQNQVQFQNLREIIKLIASTGSSLEKAA